MEYIIASLGAILAATLIVYKLANNIIGIDLRLRPLLLCAVCAMLISLVLPKIVVGFAGLPGTLAVLAIFAVIFAYFVARYEGEPSVQDTAVDSDVASCLAVDENSPGVSADKTDQNAQTEMFSGELSDTEIMDEHNNQLIESILASIEAASPAEKTSTNDSPALPEDSEVSIENSDEIAAGLVSEPFIEQEEGSIDEYVVQSVKPTEESKELIGEVVEGLIVADSDVSDTDNSQEDTDLVIDLIQEQHPGTSDEKAVEAEKAEKLIEEVVEEFIVEGISDSQVNTNFAAEMSEEEYPAIVNEITLSNDSALLSNMQTGISETNYRDLPTPQELSSDLAEVEVQSKHAIDTSVLSECEMVTATSTELTDELVSLIDEEEVVHNERNVSNEMPDEPEKSEESTEVVKELEQMSDAVVDQGENQEGIMSMPEQPFVQEADNSIMVNSEQMAEVASFESEELDDLLEFAFINKEKLNFNAAFNAFNRALTLYPDSDAAPFLIVEIGNILKNRGAYDDAIKVFSDGRALSQSKQDEMMEQEFISTIAYLRIIKNVLLQNRSGCIPFLEIPSQVIAQIDEEFKEWRSVGNI